MGDPLVLPEGSMGRIAGDLGIDAVERIYVPGTEHLWRIEVTGDSMTIDNWQPKYRSEGDPWGLAWDSCLSDGYCWIMDCGDIESVRRIHQTVPNGRFENLHTNNLSWRLPSPRSGAQRLIRISLQNSNDVVAIEPFDSAGGGIIAPPVNVPEHCRAIAWDSINGGLAGIDTSGPGLNVAWRLDVRPSMQPLVFPDSGELVINDFTDAGSDDLIVVDVRSGELLDRVPTGSRIANGMFLSPDGAGGVFYCTTTMVAHVSWS